MVRRVAKALCFRKYRLVTLGEWTDIYVANNGPVFGAVPEEDTVLSL